MKLATIITKIGLFAAGAAVAAASTSVNKMSDNSDGQGLSTATIFLLAAGVILLPTLCVACVVKCCTGGDPGSSKEETEQLNQAYFP